MRWLKRRHGVQVVGIDYDELLSGVQAANEVERGKIISRSLQQVAKAEQLTLILVKTMNKAGYGQPGIQALAGAAALGYDADLVWFLEPVFGQARQRLLTVPKNRLDGARPRILLTIKPDGLSFVEVG